MKYWYGFWIVFCVAACGFDIATGSWEWAIFQAVVAMLYLLFFIQEVTRV